MDDAATKSSASFANAEDSRLRIIAGLTHEKARREAGPVVAIQGIWAPCPNSGAGAARG
jgi:hypothetical protein